MPIRAFCAGYIDPEPNEDGDWLDQKLDRDTLKLSMMYIWMGYTDVKDREARGIRAPFEHFEFARIQDYTNWTREDFFEAVAALSDKLLGQ
ncbi:MAG: hypothetical protein AAF787_16125 [Chloroflexota bacterium]